MSSPSEHAAVIDRFYAAFQKKDAAAMCDCYTDDVEFSDPAFGPLKGERAKNMWRMLTGRAPDLTVEWNNVKTDGNSGSAHWEAHYTFSATKRKVHNIIDARFTFRDGKICKHDDVFNFWRWSRQALGPPGLVLGWSGFLQSKVRGQALKGLDAFKP